VASVVGPTGSPTVNRVLAGELCTGCGLCAGVSGGALAMTTVAPGYSRPAGAAPVAPAAEATIAAACPGAVVAPWTEGAERHPYWGPYRRCASAFATDAEVRHRSSSGGGISALLIHALDTGLVDRVLHVDADPERPTRNRIRWSRTRAEVLDGSGSRYAASSPLVEIDSALSEPGRFAFVGKPCDVSALRGLATCDPRVAERVPVALSFFCGGLPSHAGADRIIRAMGLEPEAVVRFRYRGEGWPGLTRAETADGRSAEMLYDHSWGGHLSKEVQFRCKICPDAVGGVADIACADAWHDTGSGMPSFEESEGRSLLMTRSDAGEALVASALAAGVLVAEPLAVEAIDVMQYSQARRKRLVPARLLACALTGQPRPRTGGLDLPRAARRAGVVESARNTLGTMRRIIQGRR